MQPLFRSDCKNLSCLGLFIVFLQGKKKKHLFGLVHQPLKCFISNMFSVSSALSLSLKGEEIKNKNRDWDLSQLKYFTEHMSACVSIKVHDSFFIVTAEAEGRWKKDSISSRLASSFFFWYPGKNSPESIDDALCRVENNKNPFLTICSGVFCAVEALGDDSLASAEEPLLKLLHQSRHRKCRTRLDPWTGRMERRCNPLELWISLGVPGKLSALITSHSIDFKILLKH